MKRILLTALIAAASVSATLAHAEGAYVGAYVIVGHYGFDVPGVTSNDDSANNVSGRILLGYNFNQTWAIEGGYADFGKAKYNFIANGANGSLNASSHVLYMAAKGSIPINEACPLLPFIEPERNSNRSSSGVCRNSKARGPAWNNAVMNSTVNAPGQIRRPRRGCYFCCVSSDVDHENMSERGTGVEFYLSSEAWRSIDG